MAYLGRFLRDQRGGVTVDWVALAASICLLGVAVVYGILNGGTVSMSTAINTGLDSVGFTDPGDAPASDGFGTFGGANTETTTNGGADNDTPIPTGGTSTTP